MKTTIDAAGRIVIPRDIRVAAGLEPGTAVEIGVREGVVPIEPATSDVKIVPRGRLRVAVPVEERAPLSSDQVTAARDEVRKGR